jgi:hypothetical protein
MRRLTRQAMSPLVESDKPSIRQAARQPLPVTSVGAETVEQKARRLSVAVSFRFPFQVVEANPVAFEPTVDRSEHRR